MCLSYSTDVKRCLCLCLDIDTGPTYTSIDVKVITLVHKEAWCILFTESQFYCIGNVLVFIVLWPQHLAYILNTSLSLQFVPQQTVNKGAHGYVYSHIGWWSNKNSYIVLCTREPYIDTAVLGYQPWNDLIDLHFNSLLQDCTYYLQNCIE